MRPILKNRMRSSCQRDASLKAKLGQQSYDQTIPHLEWMSNLYLNEAKATRIAKRAFEEAIAQLEAQAGRSVA